MINKRSYIMTGRRVRDEKRAGPTPTVKNLEGYLGCGGLLREARGLKLTPGSPAQGSSAKEESS